MSKAAELIVKCLENEGVAVVFGLPGEENIRFVQALASSSSIRYVLTRHEQAAAFMAATPAQRLAFLQVLDREQKTAMEERANPPRSRAPAATPAADAPAHYFRMMKELALLGYFTSEIGCTRAQRYIEAPGRYDPCVPHKPGDKSWAGHA